MGGSEVTVSDADLILGYLNEDCFLGGRMKLTKTPALEALKEKIARPMNMTVAEAASGIYRITNSHMSDLIRRATVERGYDPAGIHTICLWRRRAGSRRPVRRGAGHQRSGSAAHRLSARRSRVGELGRCL